MSNWLRFTGRMLLIGALVISMGGHLALFQMVAWGNMLVANASQAPFAEAVGKTFDGKNPCSMCKAVKQSRKDESKKPLLPVKLKQEMSVPVQLVLKLPLGTDAPFLRSPYTVGYAGVVRSVPLQPPRGV